MSAAVAAGVGLPEITAELIASLGEHRVLSTEQLRTIHLPERSLRRTQQVLASLERGGLQLAALRAEVGGEEDDERERVASGLAELEQKIERQLDAIEEGIDPILVGDRIRTLKTEREGVEARLAQLDHARSDSDAIDPDEAAEILTSVPDLSVALADADPETRRALYEAFRLPSK